MNDKPMNDDQSKAETVGRTTADEGFAGTLSRRNFLRAGATAMPVVLTLQSGEALARSSNLVSSSPGATDGGDVLCLDTTFAKELENGKFDLGLDGAALNRLRTDRTYHPLVSGGRSTDLGMTAQQFCEAGNSAEFKDGGWCTKTLPQNNIVVSAVALNSISTRLPITDNTNLNIIC